MRGDEAPENPGRRVAWFVALWAAGVAVVGALAYLLRWMIV